MFDFDAHALTLWLEYSFPGNVRELRNIVIRLTTKHAGQAVNAEQLQVELDMDSMEIDLPGLPLGQDFKSILEAAKKHLQLQKNFNLDLTVQQWEKGYVEAALLITQGNLSQAAKLLGIHRTTLYSRMQNYGSADEQRATSE
jgi:DNA-binding NtrC family response regulator